jgi:hypothetical protein
LNFFWPLVREEKKTITGQRQVLAHKIHSSFNKLLIPQTFDNISSDHDWLLLRSSYS